MSQQVTGIVVIKVNGGIIRSLDGAKLDVGGYEREPVISNGQVVGPKNKFKASTITCEVASTSDFDIIGLNALTGATIEFDCDSGVDYYITNAFSSKPCELTGSDGKVACEFMGDPAQAL